MLRPLRGPDNAPVDTSSPAGSCAWCHSTFIPRRPHGRFCSQVCRQSAFRLRRRSPAGRVAARSQDDGFRPFLRFAYADPPYPGTARRFYKHEPTFAGEVDHSELVRRLISDYDGWALSTSARALRDVLSLCPREARVCAWVKPHRVPPATYGLHNAWEPVIVLQGRRLRPGRPDRLIALPARRGGTLPGRKPIAFCAWLFDALGMIPGDTLDDLFPGTGIVSRAWAELASRGSCATENSASALG